MQMLRAYRLSVAEQAIFSSRSFYNLIFFEFYNILGFLWLFINVITNS